MTPKKDVATPQNAQPDFEFSEVNQAELGNFKDYVMKMVKEMPEGKRLAECLAEAWTADDGKALASKVPFLKGRGICYANVQKFAKNPGKAPATVSTGHVVYLLFGSTAPGRIYVVFPFDADVRSLLEQSFDLGLDGKSMVAGLQVQPCSGAAANAESQGFLVPAGAWLNSANFVVVGLLALAVARCSGELPVPSIVAESLGALQLTMVSAMTSEARFLDQLSISLSFGNQT